MSPHIADVCSVFKHFPRLFHSDNSFFPVGSWWAMANLYHFSEMIYQLPHQSWSQLQSSVVKGLDLFIFARILSQQDSLTLISTSMPVSPGQAHGWVATCDVSCVLAGCLFQTHATILLLVMWLFSANLRESLWAQEHSYYFCNYWHQVIT